MVDILISGGPVMIPLGILSLVALAIIIERLWVLRRSNFLENSTVQTLSGLLASGRYDAAVEFCRRHPGPFTDLVSALVENRHAPYEELKEILEDTGRLQLMGLQRGLPALATIVAGAPLLGLLGTVIGMIKIFSVVATAGSGITEQLSSGISQALITTATGLVIAIPALFTHSYLESRAVSILSDIEAQILDFLHLVREHPTDDAEED
ncbi:MAG: MotA/TolQ/ExbB proton channel family protein [Acidobacteria bacterium]|nr:MotA/TolQ/ExbB proton channel family protein [Acidobacteriota bacterium]